MNLNNRIQIFFLLEVKQSQNENKTLSFNLKTNHYLWISGFERSQNIVKIDLILTERRIFNNMTDQ